MRDLKSVIVFGATSAIAQACLRHLVSSGSSVYCIGRNADKLSTLLTDLRLRATSNQIIDGEQSDLLQTSEHPSIIQRAIGKLGSLEAILIAQGELSDQKNCEQSFAATRRSIDINAISVISLLTEIANLMEAQKRGLITLIGSCAGDRGRKSNYIYGSAKGMIDLFAEGLRHRLYHSSVAVVFIKPGFIDSPMTKDFEKKGLLWSRPEPISRSIIYAMKHKNGVSYVPWFWRYIMLIIRHLPPKIFNRTEL